MRAAPWNAFHKHSSNFFAPGMLPIGVVLQDPSHISDGDLTEFFNHVIAMEHPTNPDVPPRRFRINQIPTGSRTNPKWLPAVYNGVVEALEVKRGKKKIPVPTWDVSPSPFGDSSSVGTHDGDSPQPAGVVPSRLSAALEAQFQNVRIDSQAGDMSPDVEDEDAAVPGSSLPISPIATRRGRRPAAAKLATPPAPWIEGEIDAADMVESSDEDSEIGNYVPVEDDEEPEASDEEVEEFLKEDLDVIALCQPESENNDTGVEASEGMHTEGTCQSHIFIIFVTRLRTILIHDMTCAEGSLIPTMLDTDTVVRAPQDVGTQPTARLQFLQELADDSEYVTLLQRASEKVRYPSREAE